jgi:DNA invertase Pin-like site-specific DNA recombinase
MYQRVATYYTVSGQAGTFQELHRNLTQTVENRGDQVVGSFVDYGAEVRLRQRNIGWKTILASLDGVDQVAVISAADLPGKSVRDLLKLLDDLRDHGVGLFLLTEGIDTTNGSAFTVLEIVRAYRRAKLSQAIKIGQAKAVEVGKVIGRPVIPPGLQARIRTCLEQGGGIRATAKRYGVSPGTVINIFRNSMPANAHQQAA